jgi:6-pyruvoyltetrahydropterin/6-carboxytetrahydropterin synthase
LPGKTKEKMHGHLWNVSASVAGRDVGKTGVVMDFRRLKGMLDDILSELDNSTLNRLEYFQKNNPSAELVAKYIYENLEAKLPKNVVLKSVKVSEGKGFCAKFAK